MNETKCYTIQQAASLLGKSYDQVRAMIRAGKFPNAYKAECCGAWMIPAKDLASE